jgi:alpha-amylase
MKTICFYFQVHQPFRLKNYRFFNIGHDHYYYDDFMNESIIRKVADNCYLPANQLMLDLIQAYNGRFKICYSITGTALDQFEQYAPDVMESFKKLAQTGYVEFLSETYSHSLASLKSKSEFIKQVEMHKELIKKHFGMEPKVFRNTEFVYSDQIGEIVAEMGYTAMLTEGAKHILGWKSPNYLYHNARNPKLKLLLKNFKLSDDIAFRFSNKSWDAWPLTCEKYVSWLKDIDPKEEIINLFIDYETFGEHQWAETGIFDFIRAFPNAVLNSPGFKFATPTEVAAHYKPVAALNVPFPISWADEERDLTAWLGNELQDEAFNKLYELENIVNKIDDHDLRKDWLYLQTSDHFYYMCTKFFNDGDVHRYFNPYDTPYQAFINYMNVLSDFGMRIKQKVTVESPSVIDIDDLDDKGVKKLIEQFEKNIEKLKDKLKPKIKEKKKTEVISIENSIPKAKSIEKTKREVKAIEKTKPETKPIEKTKPESKSISKTKAENTPIANTKKEVKPISKTKKEIIPIEKTKKSAIPIEIKKEEPLAAIEPEKLVVKTEVGGANLPKRTKKKEPDEKPKKNIDKDKKENLKKPTTTKKPTKKK